MDRVLVKREQFLRANFMCIRAQVYFINPAIIVSRHLIMDTDSLLHSVLLCAIVGQ